jgi:hypothetical protein
MAARLAELMQKHRCVLWVGGMAHWTRIVQRLRTADFTSPNVQVTQSHTIRRARLTPTALYRMTGRMPLLLARYAKAPDRYDELEAIRELGLAACRSKAAVSLQIEGHRGGEDEEFIEPTNASVDVARMLIYARNLAASSGLREMPGLGELLTASSATMGNRYAGRLYLIAMRERLTDKSRGLSPLTYDTENGVQGYRLDGEWLSAKPYWQPHGGARMMWVVQQEDADKKIRKPYANVPEAKEGDKFAWVAYPPDEEDYEAFVRYVLEHASLPDSQESKSLPFQAGLRDGVDVRDTIRHWQDGTVYVREQANAQLRITNAVIDFTSRNEHSSVLQGKARGKGHAGWIDPDCTHVGSCSREATDQLVLQDKPCHVTERIREFSFVTLDCPTWIKGGRGVTFYDRVINPLVRLPEGSNDLYDWLEIMFEFCARKTVAYYAAYVPSQRIQRIARKYHVRLVHIPLTRIPKPLLKRNQKFRFLRLTKAQWDDLVKAIAEQKNAWVPERSAEVSHQGQSLTIDRMVDAFPAGLPVPAP